MAATMPTFAKNYIGSRPTLTPAAMRRVGGGFSQLSEPLHNEIEGLYALVERLRTEKESAEKKAAAAEATASTARASQQVVADQLAARHDRERQLAVQLGAAHAALADRGLSIDAATQRARALESQSRLAAATQRDALEAAERAQAEVAVAEARAAERDKQVAVLMHALRERTAEVEKLREREGREADELERLRAGRDREIADVAHRCGEIERELRRTMAADERRHEAELQALRGELEHANRRARVAEEAAQTLERERHLERHEHREQLAASTDELDQLRAEVSATKLELGPFPVPACKCPPRRPHPTGERDETRARPSSAACGRDGTRARPLAPRARRVEPPARGRCAAPAERVRDGLG
jgi:colicin import membrane protein